VDPRVHKSAQHPLAADRGACEHLAAAAAEAERYSRAAICAATVAVSRIGLLRGRRHTSNGLEYLKSQVDGYSDAAQYVDVPAVRDRGLITASGLADVEFARELFEELEVLTPADRAQWAQLFRSAKLPGDAA
jgi:putative intracellular protease/amidase